MRPACFPPLPCWLSVLPALAVLFVGVSRLPEACRAQALVPRGQVMLRGVEGRLDHLAYDPATHRLFISALENQSVEIVDLARRQQLPGIKGVRDPQGLLVIPGRNRLIVASRGDGTCRSFDATTLAEGPWVDLGRNADNLRYEPARQWILVGSGGEPGDGLVSIIELASLLPAAEGGRPAPPQSPADFRLLRPRQGVPLAEIALPSHPESLQIDAATGRVLVNLPDEHRVTVLQLGTNSLAKVADWPVTVGSRNFPLDLDPAHQRLFVATRQPARLAVYHLRTGALLADVPCVGDADDLQFDAALGRIYLMGGEGAVEVFQLAEGVAAPVRLLRLPTAARARTGLFIPELHLLAVAAPHTTNTSAAILLFGVSH